MVTWTVQVEAVMMPVSGTVPTTHPAPLTVWDCTTNSVAALPPVVLNAYVMFTFR